MELIESQVRLTFWLDTQTRREIYDQGVSATQFERDRHLSDINKRPQHGLKNQIRQALESGDGEAYLELHDLAQSAARDGFYRRVAQYALRQHINAKLPWIDTGRAVVELK